MASYKSPGKAHREGMTLVQLLETFPDEATATKWFEDVVWSGERCCGKCGSMNTRPVPKAKPMPYWCPDCRSYFSVRTGTPMARSNVPLRKWAIAIYLCLTSLKSVSSMKLHRDIGVSQSAAWFMLHRIREACRWRQEARSRVRSKSMKHSLAARRRTCTPQSGISSRDVAGWTRWPSLRQGSPDQARASDRRTGHNRRDTARVRDGAHNFGCDGLLGWRTSVRWPAAP